MKKDFNVVVIGAGSGGLVSAYICAVLKAKVALVERHKMGGDCLNTGCVPSKALIRTASFLSQVRRHKALGIKHASAEVDFSEVMERVARVIGKVAPHDSIDRYTRLGVHCIRGEAKIISPQAVRVDGKTLTTRNIIVATGAKPFIPPLPGLDKINVLHTDNIWTIRDQPKRLVVLGGGPIGAEMSQCFARLGTKVTQIEMGPHLLAREDDDVIQIIQDRFTEEGVDIRLGTKAVAVDVCRGGNILKVEKNGRAEDIPFDRMFVAAGREPSVKGFGLEDLGAKRTDRGALWTDAYGETSVPGIFACGDVTSPYQFTHMAAHQAWYAAVNALFRPFKKFRVDFETVPWCTYTDPEVARVGLNEMDAKARNVPYESTIYPLRELDRAITDEEDLGMVKVLTKPGKDVILGVTICGYHAGDLLSEFILAKKHGLGLNKILGTIHMYPTMAEANKYAAGAWKKTHAPKKLLALIGKFHAFRR